MARSEGFGAHKETKYKLDGCEVDKEFPHGFDINEYNELREAAKSSCEKVDKTGDIIQKLKVGRTKRKSVENKSPTNKKSKMEVAEDARLEEMKDSAGLEAEYRTKYICRGFIPLSQIENPTSLAKPFNPFRVEHLKKQMVDNFGPESCVLTVIPKGPKKFDSSDVTKNNYYVIHGQHRLAALQALDREGKLSSLPTMSDRLVFCYVVGTDSPVLVNYSSVRGNTIQADVGGKPTLVDLLAIFKVLREADGSKRAKDTLERLANFMQAPQLLNTIHFHFTSSMYDAH